MATSVDRNTDITMALPKEHADRHLQVQQRSRRRRPGDGQKVKKQPQRGMGVAQLERLRALEWRKRMSETNAAGAATRFPHVCFGAVSSPMQFPEMAELWPGRKVNVVAGNQSVWGFDGLVEIRGSPAASEHFPPDLYAGNGSVNTDINLSSVPYSANCRHENCSACQKKKRVNGENLGCCWTKSDANERRFLGLSIGQNQETKQHNQSTLETEAPSLVPQATYAIRNGQPGVELVTVHKTTSSGSDPGKTATSEYYEFFPSNNNKNPAIIWGGEEEKEEENRRLITGSSSSSIDLSLKLSY